MASAVDFKKLDRQLYLPSTQPELVEVPSLRFFMVDGEGDPNTAQAYADALQALYALSYAVKMSKMGERQPEGYFDYVVPPLEGLWWSKDSRFDGLEAFDKSKFLWTAMIRQPDFVTPAVLQEARAVTARKKPEVDTSLVRLEDFTEGLCVQVMHLGPYDSEPATVRRMEDFVLARGYQTDLSPSRRHHEIYLGDPRKTAPEKLRTVIRHPVRR